MKAAALWLAMHAEIVHPDDPDRIVLLTVKVADLTTEGSGRVTLDGVPQEGVSFPDALTQEVVRAMTQFERSGDEAARRADG